MRHHAQPLPKSLTHATLIVDDEEEETVLPNEEYKHIVAYLGQEEDRMEMDWLEGCWIQGLKIGNIKSHMLGV